jgi:ABC-type Zn2+ transport system substrate-binding protein/surface adhesin
MAERAACGVRARRASIPACASATVASSTTPCRSVVAGGLRKVVSPKVIVAASTSSKRMSIASSMSAWADFSISTSAWP